MDSESVCSKKKKNMLIQLIHPRPAILFQGDVHLLVMKPKRKDNQYSESPKFNSQLGHRFSVSFFLLSLHQSFGWTVDHAQAVLYTQSDRDRGLLSNYLHSIKLLQEQDVSRPRSLHQLYETANDSIAMSLYRIIVYVIVHLLDIFVAIHSD